MKIAVFKNFPLEEASLAGEFLTQAGHQLTEFDLHGGQDLPDLSDFDGAIAMGGPMNACEDDKYPFLAQETEWVADWTRREKPFAGVCLGSQILARATGGSVTKSPEREIGHCRVELTDEGVGDAAFKGYESRFTVFQWHGDMFVPPSGSANLARSEACENQAFRVGRSLGIQFHPEVTRADMKEWLAEYAEEVAKLKVNPGEVLAGFEGREAIYCEQCRTLFLEIFRQD